MSDAGPKSPGGPFEGRPFLARVLDLLTGKPAEEGRSIEAFMEAYLDQAHTLQPGEREILTNLLTFADLRVDDVMVPRADIVAVEISTPLDELAVLFRDAQHSRLPIYRETLDDPVGMVHVKDLLALIVPNDAQAVAQTGVLQQVRRPILFVPPSMRIVDLLVKMQNSRVHMALVIDEYGGTDGLVSIEDLVEQIVGEIEDEHDLDETATTVSHDDGTIEMSARLPIEDLEELTGPGLVPEDREEDVDTLGGLIFSLVGRVPQRGELIRHPSGIEFEILDADPRRVKKVRLHGVKRDIGTMPVSVDAAAPQSGAGSLREPKQTPNALRGARRIS